MKIQLGGVRDSTGRPQKCSLEIKDDFIKVLFDDRTGLFFLLPLTESFFAIKALKEFQKSEVKDQ